MHRGIIVLALSISCAHSVPIEGPPEAEPEARACDPELDDPDLRRRAMTEHEAGQHGQHGGEGEAQRARFEQAVSLYSEYLEQFPCSRWSYDIRFYVAEILLHRLARYRRRDATISKRRVSPDGGFTQDALYGAVEAFEQAEPSQEHRALLLEAMTHYERSFPHARDTPNVIYRHARLLHDGGDQAAAFELFRRLVEEFPTSEAAASAREELERAEGEENTPPRTRRDRLGGRVSSEYGDPSDSEI